MTYLPHTLRTSFGPRFLPLSPMVRVSLTRAELHHVIRGVERERAECEAAGQHDAAVRLAWRAAALREAAR